MSKTQHELADQLVTWYQAVYRQLPWRETTDPYAIWVSEIMLQQTQVTTVIPYYKRFLERYPTVRALAQASLDEVLKSWEGLGYYARARNLHKAAQKIMTEHKGLFPDNFESIHALPGIGESTAGAILTFAFQLPHPILDGNVKRVLSRFYGVDRPVQEPAVIAELWEHSKRLLPSDPETAYAFNQALMELGATRCTPKKPTCPECPWQKDCKAYATDRQHSIPVKIPLPRTPHYTIGVGVIWKDNQVLIALRPEEGLLGGLWEFPGGKCHEDESLQACVRREIEEETGLKVTVGAKIATVKHAYTHFKITLHAFECHYVAGVPEPKVSQKLKWVGLDEIEQYAFPKANKSVLEALKQNKSSQLTFF
jgi:A/G-specific adenine glycosylase